MSFEMKNALKKLFVYFTTVVERKIMKYTICKLLIFVFAKFAILQIDASFKLIKNGNTWIIINFAAALTETVTAIIFAEHDKLWEINQNRIVGFERTSLIDSVLPNHLLTNRIFKKFAREIDWKKLLIRLPTSSIPILVRCLGNTRLLFILIRMKMENISTATDSISKLLV